jgi:hypothetical protein
MELILDEGKDLSEAIGGHVLRVNTGGNSPRR